MGGAKLFFTVCSTVLIVSLVGTTFALENLSMTQAGKEKLDQFKEAVSKTTFPAEWMQQELTFVRYLRARDWDVRRAKSMLLETVAWWEENNMKDIHNEDWSNIEKDFPLHTDGVDKLGQPVMVLTFAEWELRQAAVQGRMDHVIRWFIKGFDDVHLKSFEYQKSGKTNGTQWNLIADMDKLSRQQHLCIQCLRFYTELAITFESRYPGAIDKIFVVNAVRGRMNLAIRVKGYDDVHTKSFVYQKLGKTNGTQWNVIADMDKLSRQQQLCIQCLRFYTELVVLLESRYPGAISKMFAINSPSIFQVILGVVNPILSKRTLNALEVLGTNKEEWSKVLDAHFEKDQLPENLGGTRKYATVWNEI
ncbi:Protein real-time [Folsomia candida]|uniref:Protein real-time n=1 Tax=Folsomia candida TaxID=158441 RepID=A0A226DWZ8_FOLCA|nr:Protein real-time [Folsomia candida]